jgi:hypothetical protein
MKTSFLCFALLLVACSGSSGSVADPESSSGGPGDVSSTDPAPSSSSSSSSTSGSTGSPDGPIDVGPPASPADCDAFGATVCAKLDACDHIAAEMLGAACTERYAGMCNARSSAPSTGFTTTNLAACEQAFVSATCDAVFGGAPPTACSFKGGLALDAPCAFDEQCASGECSATTNDCGKCIAATPKAPSLPEAGLGEPCSATGNTAPRCNSGFGLVCDAKTSTCTTIPLVAIGQACGFVDGSIVMCKAGGRCASTSSGAGTCVAETPVGGACTKDEQCPFVTSCVAGTCGYATASDICK